MPKREQASGPQHSTRNHRAHCFAPDHGRLDRGSRIGRKYGDQAYSAEELVAELGSAFLCAEFGFDNDIIDNSAAYIDHWVKFLTDHDGAIVNAASMASKAVDFMRGLAIADEQLAEAA